MSSESRAGLALLGAAAALGLLGDFLFRNQPLGLNVLLYAAAFVAALALMLRFSRAPLHQGRRLMAAPLLLFAALFVWHDSPLLVGVNLVALAAAVALGALRRRGPRIHLRGVVEYAGGAASAAVAVLAGIIPVLQRDIDWREIGSGARSARALAVGRGLAIGAPLVLVFGALFIAADAVFKNLVVGAIPNLANPLGHVFAIGASGWIAGGLLRDLAAPREAKRQFSPVSIVRQGRRRISIGMAETTIVLVALNALFLAFVIVQFRYLFGGRALVEARTHLTYAQYARHGFFELLAVAALALPTLLLADWAVRRTKTRDELVFRALAGTLLALLFVVIASALQRMRLYVHEYGLTELRLYATAVIVWIAAVCLWFGFTVLRGRPRLFAVGALVAGFAATAAFNVINPDALIVRTNLARPTVDPAYIASLSDDAVPTLVSRLPGLDPSLSGPIARRLLERQPARYGWQGWNLSRSHASAVLTKHRRELEQLAR